MTEQQITTRINEETVDLSALDFEIPCEWENTGTEGDCGQSNPADWLVIKKRPLACPHDEDRYMCDSCWRKRNATGLIRCPRGCFHSAPAMFNIARLERIRP